MTYQLQAFSAAPAMQEPLFWTPSAIQNLAKNLHTSMLSFNDDMARAKAAGLLPAGQLEAWRVFRDSWASWYGATTASTWLWSATVSTIEGYSTQLANWRLQYLQWTGKTAAGVDPPAINASLRIDTSGEQLLIPTAGTWTGLYWGLGISVVALGGVLYWLHRDKIHGYVGRVRNKAKKYGDELAPANWRSRAQTAYKNRQNNNVTAMAGFGQKRRR